MCVPVLLPNTRRRVREILTVARVHRARGRGPSAADVPHADAVTVRLATGELQPSDLRMLRELAHEARLSAMAALPQHTVRNRLRRRLWMRVSFLRDSIRLLELLEDLARSVERRVWEDD